MMNNQQYLEAMGRLQPSSQFASMMTPSFSTSAGVMAQAAMPQNGNAAVMATSNAINNQIDTSVATGQSPRPLWRNGEKTFPYKVYDMLEFAESSGNTDICSWLPTGDSFVIHDRKLFTEFILPRFFLHKKWRSFVSIYYAYHVMCLFSVSPNAHVLLMIPLPIFYYRLVNSTFGASNVTLASLSLMRIAIHSSSVGT
jgi:hypothetical protein